MIELKIYEKGNKKKVEKTYKVDGYELMLGTVEDFMNIIDIDKIDDNMELAKMVLKCYKQILPLLMDIFPDATEEELKRTKVDELVVTIKQVGTSIVEGFGVLKQGN